jgi:uncharacterized protein YbjT (DUF2867 family)
MSELDTPTKVLNLMVGAVDVRSLEVRQDAIAVVLHPPVSGPPAFRAVLRIPVAEALADVLRRGLAALGQRPAGSPPAALPRLARAELAVRAGRPAALRLRLDDGREFAVAVSETDLAALRRMLDDATGRLAGPEHPSRPAH